MKLCPFCVASRALDAHADLKVDGDPYNQAVGGERLLRAALREIETASRLIVCAQHRKDGKVAA